MKTVDRIKHRWRGSRKWYVVGYIVLAVLLFVLVDSSIRAILAAILPFASIGVVFYLDHQHKRQTT